MPQETQATQEAGGQAQAIKQAVGDDLLATAREHDVDVDAIVQKQAEQNAKYSKDTIVRFATTAITREIEAANAEEIKGIIMGSRDRFGKNWPRRHSLVRSGGEHLEVSTWDGSLPGGDGTEREIPTGGALVGMEVDYEEEYDSYQGRRLTGVKQYDVAELVENLSKVAIPPSELTAADEYETVVVEGSLRYVNPQTIFEDGEMKGDGPVLMEDERGEHQPHFEIVLDADGGTRFRGHVERQSYGRPYFEVPDLEPLVNDAYERFDEPDRQADFVGDGLGGIDVIVVGNVNSFDRDRDDEGNPVTYIDVGVTSIVATETQSLDAFTEADEADDGDEADGADDDLDEPVEAEPEAETETEPEAETEPEPEPDETALAENACPGCGDTFDSEAALNGHLGSCDEYTPDGSDGSDGDPEPDEGAVEAVENAISQYEELTGEDLDTVEQVRESLASIDDSVDDVAIRAALGDGSAQSNPEDRFEAILEGGTYSCPVDDCLASAGSIGELAGHAVDAHGIPDDVDPKEWLRERV